MKRAAIYVRLSKAAEESVSIERQIEACEQYAAARGWEVVLVAKDDGVSATKNKPEERDGWREVLDAADRFDVVLVWKVDRLARNVLDFLHADETLQGKRAGLAAVADPVDMTTAQGRAFATMLAVFAEMEAAAIRARTTAARRHLVGAGRVVGGDLPAFLAKVPNPDGAGYVARPREGFPEAISTAVAGVLDGTLTTSEIARRWTAQDLPRAGKGKRARDSWSVSSVIGLLRNPALYGATVVSREVGGERVRDVLRNEDRTPKIDPARVIVDRGTFERLQALLDSRKRGPKPTNLPLLSGVARCGQCSATLVSHRRNGRADYRCNDRDCASRSAVQMERLDDYVVEEFRKRFGRVPATRVEEVAVEADPVAVAALEADVADLSEAISEALEADDYARLPVLNERRKEAESRLQALRDSTDVEERRVLTGFTFGEAYDATDTENERRDLLASAFGAVYVRKGTARGRYAKIEDRVSFGRDEEPDYLAGQLD